MDDLKCLCCTCTWETGCREEKRQAEAMKNRQRLAIPPKKLPLPDIARKHAQGSREEINRKARENHRKRIERFGGTVRARK